MLSSPCPPEQPQLASSHFSNLLMKNTLLCTRAIKCLKYRAMDMNCSSGPYSPHDNSQHIAFLSHPF